MSRSIRILNFGDRFVSGRSYEDLLRGVVHRITSKGIPDAVLWIARKFGYNGGSKDFEDCDLWIREGQYDSTDGDAHSTLFVSKRHPEEGEEDGYSCDAIYRECLFDADDLGFVGDWDISPDVSINARCISERGKEIGKSTSLNLIFRDAVTLLSEKIDDCFSRGL